MNDSIDNRLIEMLEKRMDNHEEHCNERQTVIHGKIDDLKDEVNEVKVSVQGIKTDKALNNRVLVGLFVAILGAVAAGVILHLIL